MEVRSIKDYKAEHPERRPRLVTFHSAVYADNEKKTMSIVIPVMVKNGNVDPVLKAAEEAGGIGMTAEDGTFLYIPWPPAAIEVKDFLEVSSGNDKP